MLDPNVINRARAEIAAAIGSHERPALQFSGGKDSLACLYLLRPYWNRLTVIWANAGDPYPETIKQMEEVRSLVAHFHEIKGFAAANDAMQAFPVDMLPIRASPLGRLLEPSKKGFTLHSRYDCCAANFWKPMADAVEQGDFDLIIRGQRDSEAKRAPASSGAKDDAGRTYVFPLQAWSKEQVFSYLRAEGVEIPRQYGYGIASLDCLHCTAYLDESAGKLRYLRDFHPAASTEYERRLNLIQEEQRKQSRLVSIALGGLTPFSGEGCGD